MDRPPSLMPRSLGQGGVTMAPSIPLPVQLESGPCRRSRAARHDGALSPREIQCISLIALGLTDDEIGSRLGIRRCTIRFHLGNICMKLGAINRCSAVYRATVAGLIRPADD